MQQIYRHAYTEQVLLKGVSLIGLLHCLEDGLVDSETDGRGESGQGQIGHHTDHAELSQREEQQQHTAKHQASLLHITPVQQLHRYTVRQRARECEKVNKL